MSYFIIFILKFTIGVNFIKNENFFIMNCEILLCILVKSKNKIKKIRLLRVNKYFRDFIFMVIKLKYNYYSTLLFKKIKGFIF